MLGWALPAGGAGRLRAETGQPFAGQAPGQLDFAIRGQPRPAALLHASQLSPASPLWRRLKLQGDIEHLRWLVRPVGPAGAGWPARSASGQS